MSVELVIQAYLVGGLVYWLAQLLFEVGTAKRFWKEKTGRDMTGGVLFLFFVMLLCMCLALWPWLVFHDFKKSFKNRKEGKR